MTEPRAIATIDAAIAKAVRTRAETMGTIDRKLLEISVLRKHYAAQGNTLDGLLEERSRAGIAEALVRLEQGPLPLGEEPTMHASGATPGLYVTGGPDTTPPRADPPRPSHL